MTISKSDTHAIETNLAAVRARIDAAALRAGRDPASVTLVAATKSVEPARVAAAITAGLRDCGENIVRDGQERITALGDTAKLVTWHFIGHLQSNKSGAALEHFDIVHSVDSERLAQQLSRRAEAIGRTARILLEVNVAAETSKYGFSPDEVGAAVSAISHLPNLQLEGLMTVAPAVPEAEQIRPVFRELRQLAEANSMKQLSMGMTDDFEVAIEEGATLVRIGRAIFGERPS